MSSCLIFHLNAHFAQFALSVNYVLTVVVATVSLFAKTAPIGKYCVCNLVVCHVAVGRHSLCMLSS